MLSVTWATAAIDTQDVKVRTAGCMQLLESCSPTLPAAAPLLLEVLFTLAQDDWPQVACPVRAWLANQRRTAEDAAQRPLPGKSCSSKPDISV